MCNNQSVAILDENGTIIAVNLAWRTFAQANLASLQLNVCEGANYLAACDQVNGENSEEAAAAASGIRAVMHGEQEEFTLEYSCHSPYEKCWFIVRVTRLAGVGLACVVVSHENITTRKHVEILLKQSEQRYQGMLEDQTEIIARFKADGTVLYVNEACCRLYGKRNDEMVGDKWHPVVVQEDLALIQDKLDTLSPANPVVTIENRIVVADGTIRWGQFVNRAFYDEHGSLTEIQTVGRDITERKQVEKELHDSETFLRLCQDVGGIGSWEADLINNKQKWSENCFSLFELPAFENPTWEHFLSVILPDDRQRVIDATQSHLDHGTRYEVEFRVVTLNGVIRWMRSVGQAERDENGKPVKMRGIGQDITNRKKIEQELSINTQQLRDLLTKYESSQEAERKIIAREVHDELGQLLTAIRLNISLIRTRYAKDNPALMELVKDTTKLVDQAINGVSDVIENLRPTVLGLGVHETVKWLRNDFCSRTGISCILSASDIGVDMNETRSIGVFRIVQESLTNVIRHAGKVREVNISMELSEGDLCISVKDDGSGFDLKNTKLLASYGLLGMRERALALDGQLDIVSALGKGTVVTLRIPVNDRIAIL